MQTNKNRILIIAILLLTAHASMAQTTTTATNNSQTTKSTTMKTYLIERDIPGAGQWTPEKLKAVSQKSCSVLDGMGPQIQWIQSYVTGDKIFCIYKATSEDLIREHAAKSGFPANVITEVDSQISPATAKN